MIDAAALKTEITTDPGGLDYDGKSNAAAEVLINVPRTAGRKAVAFSDVLRHFATSGLYDRLKKGASENADGPTRAASGALLVMINSPHTENLDLADSRISGLFDRLVTANVISTDQRAALFDLAAVTLSRAEELFGHGARVDFREIRTARA